MALMLFTNVTNAMSWSKATEQAVKLNPRRKGTVTNHSVEQLRGWLRAFIADREQLPFNLQSIGAYVRAQDIVDYLSRPDVQARHNLKETISLATAKRWMHIMDYRVNRNSFHLYLSFSQTHRSGRREWQRRGVIHRTAGRSFGTTMRVRSMHMIVE